jgi:hypothetical protein
MIVSQYLVTIGVEGEERLIAGDELEELIRSLVPPGVHSLVMADDTDGAEGSFPARVYIVERQTGDGDGLYAFVDCARAEDYANRYDGAVVHEEMLMNDSAAAQFLIDTSEDDPEPEDAGSQTGTA